MPVRSPPVSLMKIPMRITRLARSLTQRTLDAGVTSSKTIVFGIGSMHSSSGSMVIRPSVKAASIAAWKSAQSSTSTS